MHLQHDLVEEAIRRRQTAMAAADPNSPIHGPRLEQLETQAHTAVVIAAIRFADEHHFQMLVDVLGQLVSEVASARDAVEAERAMRRLL